MTNALILLVSFVVGGVLGTLVVFALEVMFGGTKKRVEIHQPCYFCGVSEYEHRQECPVTHYRKPFKISGTWIPFDKAYETWKATPSKFEYPKDPRGLVIPTKEDLIESIIVNNADAPHVVRWSATKPQFKPGQWVRRVGGERSWLLKVDRMDVDPKFFHGLDEHYHFMIAQVSNYEPAIPRKGEFWDKESCGKHPWTPHPNAWPEANLSEWILCGCFAPGNFGKGNS